MRIDQLNNGNLLSLQNLSPLEAKIPIFQGGVTYPVTVATLMAGGKAYIDPHDYGAKGDAFGAHDAMVTGGGAQLASASYAFTLADVGKNIWVNNGNTRTITAVNNGVATINPPLFNSSNDLWLMGTDDTAAIQAALDAARAMQGIDLTENAGATDGLINMAGVVQLRPGKAYLISNSQASYNAGKFAALTVYRRTELRGAGRSFQRSALVLRPGSYGHMVSNLNAGDTAYSDFIALASFTLYGYDAWNPNALNGIHLHVAFNGYDKTDPFNRVYDVFAFRMRGSGFYFQGRGELMMENCVSMYSRQYGLQMNGIVDYKVTNCNAGGNSRTGFRIRNSGAGHYVNCKSFYNGASGGSDIRDSANWALESDQMRNGLTYFTSCEGQESRGSSWVIESGLNVFNGCQALDPGRAALSTGTLPSVVAGIHLRGASCRQNTFNGCVAMPSVAIFGSPNWGNAGNAVHIDDYTLAGGGPQENRGDIYTFVPSYDAGGTLDPGTQYASGFGPVGGPGATNGRNTNLRINGKALSPAVPAAPTGLTPTAGSLSVALAWAAAFPNGAAVTDYIPQYKETSSGTWLTFSDGVGTATTATVTGLTAGISYDFRVSAVNSVGTGAVSATVTATPTA